MSDTGHFVCASCAPKPGAFAGFDPRIFLGKYVKLAFPASHPASGKSTLEHMWVKVTGLATDTTDGAQLTGTLDNHPMLETGMAYGDEVGFNVSEIEDFRDHNQPKEEN